MSYVDSFVIPVPKKNLKTYRRMSRTIGKVWCEHGAVSYTECLADDVRPGKVTSFPQSVKLKAGEIVAVDAVGEGKEAVFTFEGAPKNPDIQDTIVAIEG